MSNRRRAQGIRVKYVFIKAYRREFDTAVMCRLLDVSRSMVFTLNHATRIGTRHDMTKAGVVR